MENKIQPEKMLVAIKGMHCASCSARIEKVLANLDGIYKAIVNLAHQVCCGVSRERGRWSAVR